MPEIPTTEYERILAVANEEEDEYDEDEEDEEDEEEEEDSEPEPVAASATEYNLEAMMFKPEHARTAASEIDKAFQWESTKEGHTYWADVTARLKGMIRQMEYEISTKKKIRQERIERKIREKRIERQSK
jgi:hypothetical protein